MTSDPEQVDTPEKFPGVETAYDFIIPSYQLVELRMQAADSRIQGLQAFAATLAVAATVLASGLNDDIEFGSPWLWTALAAFVATVFVGATAHVFGNFNLISPNRLFEDWLWREPWQFKKDLLAFAGEDFHKNVSRVNLKGYAAILMTGLFVLETVCLVVWVVTES